MSAGLVASTVTPGRTPPVASLTTPAMDPVCAETPVGININKRPARQAMPRNGTFFIDSPFEGRFPECGQIYWKVAQCDGRVHDVRWRLMHGERPPLP